MGARNRLKQRKIYANRIELLISLLQVALRLMGSPNNELTQNQLKNSKKNHIKNI